MAAMMNIPVIGLVENLSYMLCPHGGEKLYPFGKRGEQEAKRFGIPCFDSLPIDPKLAELCDQGKIEEYEGRYLDSITQAIHGLKK